MNGRLEGLAPAPPSDVVGGGGGERPGGCLGVDGERRYELRQPIAVPPDQCGKVVGGGRPPGIGALSAGGDHGANPTMDPADVRHQPGDIPLRAARHGPVQVTVGGISERLAVARQGGEEGVSIHHRISFARGPCTRA